MVVPSADWEVSPIATVGETYKGYTPPGILDGISVFRGAGRGIMTAYVNHELRSNVGYAYDLANGTSLTGARISTYEIQTRTLKVVDADLAYDTIYDTDGQVVTGADQINANSPAAPFDSPAGVAVDTRNADGSLRTTAEHVEDFLGDGNVVYAGAGSMSTGDPVQRGRTVVTAIRSAGKRALLARGWGGLDVPAALRGDDLLVVDAVDHQHVFPRVDAAIHHGGAGTVHAATAAGTVSLIVPFIADQPWWGRRLQERGLAPAATPTRRLTVEALTQKIEAAPRDERAVADVAAQMALEDGTGHALHALAAVAATTPDVTLASAGVSSAPDGTTGGPATTTVAATLASAAGNRSVGAASV